MEQKKADPKESELQIIEGEQLKTLQTILLATLLEIDRVCRRHNIKYFLGGGTLLGAIRHQGFIPWDDDADLMMLREDYEKFQKVAAEELSDRLFLQLPNYNPYTRVRVNDTVFASEFMMRFSDHNGIFIDIFAHDRTAKHGLTQKLHLMVTKVTRSIVFNKWGNTKVQGDGSHRLIRWLVSRIKNVIPMPMAIAVRDKTLTCFRGRKTGWLYDGMGQNMQRGAFPEAFLEEAVDVEFEGHRLSVPKDYDDYLTWLYGDYMQLPPEEKRRASHESVKIDFGKYERLAKERRPEELFR